jgi:hypothetical protein
MPEAVLESLAGNRFTARLGVRHRRCGQDFRRSLLCHLGEVSDGQEAEEDARYSREDHQAC